MNFVQFTTCHTSYDGASEDQDLAEPHSSEKSQNAHCDQRAFIITVRA
jgi:hypothetical protein